ncbi:MAG: hypothetical protein OEZ59_12475, partial [Deltaproteobacteria bacterium]|nr:hypothetical protein [Deltaproteobacteria bacterium]
VLAALTAGGVLGGCDRNSTPADPLAGQWNGAWELQEKSGALKLAMPAGSGGGAPGVLFLEGLDLCGARTETMEGNVIPARAGKDTVFDLGATIGLYSVEIQLKTPAADGPLQGPLQGPLYITVRETMMGRTVATCTGRFTLNRN